METLDASNRQLLGCAYERRTKHATPWSPLSINPKWVGDAPTVCVGYSVALPDVTEAVRARAHWSNGELAAFCGGQPTEHMLVAVEILEGSHNAVESFKIEEAREQ